MQDIQRTTVDLPRDLHEALRRASFELNRSMNSIMNDAILNHLAKEKTMAKSGGYGLWAFLDENEKFVGLGISSDRLNPGNAADYTHPPVPEGATHMALIASWSGRNILPVPGDNVRDNPVAQLLHRVHDTAEHEV